MSFDITKIVQAKLLLMITLNRKINHICLSKNKSTTERSLWTDIFVRNENNPSCIIRDGRVFLYLFLCSSFANANDPLFFFLMVQKIGFVYSQIIVRFPDILLFLSEQLFRYFVFFSLNDRFVKSLLQSN